MPERHPLTRRYRRAKTTTRGLGASHQTARQAALAALTDGDPCFRCELRGVYHPMYRWAITRRPDGRLVSRLLDLDDYPGRVFGGPQTKRLSWRRCNRHAGAVLGNRLRAKAPSPYNRW